MKSTVCKLANALKGVTRSEAFIRAWAIAKGRATEPVKGVMKGNRQEALARLTIYDQDAVKVELKREHANEYDRNAIAVWVSVNGSRGYKLGYMTAASAAIIAPAIDKGNTINASIKAIVGGCSGFSYGARLRLTA